MIHPMQYELERAYHRRCEHNAARKRQAVEAEVLGKISGVAGPRPGVEVVAHICRRVLLTSIALLAGARPTRSTLPWAGVVVISLLASLAFNAGVIGALGHSEASHEYRATLRSNTLNEQDDAQLQLPMNRVCWPIEAGVDAQCFDSP
jgi:hypothetical protein